MSGQRVVLAKGFAADRKFHEFVIGAERANRSELGQAWAVNSDVNSIASVNVSWTGAT